MNFDLTDDQVQLRESFRTVLAQECGAALARDLYEAKRAPEQPWRSARELGWTGLAIPEELGGLGLGCVELALLVEELGRCLATGPLLPTLTQFAPALLEAGSAEQQARFLAPVAAGELRGSLALASERGSFLLPDLGEPFADDSLTARPAGRDWILEGSRCFVVEGSCADEVVAVARVPEGDGVGLFVVGREDWQCGEPTLYFDASRTLATLHFASARVAPDRVLGTPGESAEALARILDWATTASAAESVGAARSLLDATVEYAKQREQFGRPIGSFQAIQHKLADMLISSEKARVTAYYAAMTVAEDHSRRRLAASMAKAAAGECQRRITREAIQIHGGVGYTWEQDIHLYVKRLKSNEALFGTTAVHHQRIASLLGV